MRMITVTFFIQDAKAKSAKLLFRSDLDTSFPLATPEEALDAAIFYYQELAKLLDLYLKGRIANISITLDCPMPSGIKLGALNHSDVEEGGLCIYPKASNSAYFRHTIPTLDHSVFANAREISYDDMPSGLQDFFAMLVQSEDITPNEDIGRITDNRGQRVARFPIVHQVFKPSRK